MLSDNLKYLIRANSTEYAGNEKAVNGITPLVSVMVTAYQHENYIKVCLDGLLMQQTNFPFEIVIGEDDSKDMTRQLCMNYADRFPDKIRLFLRNRNATVVLDENGHIFRSVNDLLTMQSCRGKYMAICEGDDYWTDPRKLQKQVDLLEAEPEVALVYTCVDVKDETTGSIKKADLLTSSRFPQGYVFNELIVDNYFISTLSIMLRFEILLLAFEELKYELVKWLCGDLPLWLYFSYNHKVAFINESTGVYRRISESATQSANPAKKFKFVQSTYSCRLFFATKYSIDNNIWMKMDAIFIRQLVFFSFVMKNNIMLKEAVKLESWKKQPWLIRFLIKIFLVSDVSHAFVSLFHNNWISRKR
jgi:glycosyltransferase involved in cell wall biosynthesis